MFVRKSKYEKLYRDCVAAGRLIESLSKMVLELQLKLQVHKTFSPDEIDTMIRLCHPDKHNNSQASNRITAKLLEMRK